LDGGESVRRSIPTGRGRPPLPGGPFPVTDRQAAILELAAGGLSDKEIAQCLGVTHRTVRSHLERLYNSSGIRGRVAVVVAWVLSSDRNRRDWARSREWNDCAAR
jgi:DNA-binding CsgD family transcriptional regulator